MKKLLFNLLLLLMVAIGAVAQQSLPYSYGFEDNDLSVDGWSTVNESSANASDFGIATAAKRTGEYGFRFSSYTNSSTGYNQYLISPELNAASGLVFQFYYAASSSYGTEKIKVGYSTTDNEVSSFTFGSEISTNSTSWILSEEYVFPAGTKYVAIFYYSNYQYRLFVDDLTFANPPTCPKPTVLAYSEVTTRSVHLSWTNGDLETAWQICLNDDEEHLISATTNPFDLTGLNPETAYAVKVRAVCGEDDNSNWSNEVNFTTLPPCPAPTELVFSNITTSYVSMSWTPGESETHWNFQYKKSTIAEWGDDVIALTDPTCYIAGLEPGTTYNVRVQADCESEGTSGTWLTGSFTTLYGIPFVEEFGTTSTPVNWMQRQGLLSDVMGGTALTTGSAWYFGSSNEVFGSHAYINIYGSSRKHWLITPTVVMDANVRLSFDLALTAYSGTDAASGTCDDDKFVVLISTDNGETWTILCRYDNDGNTNEEYDFVYNSIPTAGKNVTIDLSSYASDNIMIAFYGESTVNGNGDNNLHIDNVSIEYIPTCERPTDLAYSNVTDNAATLTWTAGGEEPAWQICVNGDEGNLINVEGTPAYDLSGLTAATTYQVKVRANCGDSNGDSEWTSEIEFTTNLCSAEDMCSITYELTDSYGDGWNGNKIQVKDVETGIILAELANQNLDYQTNVAETNTGSLSVCKDRDLSFEWVSGSYANETSYVIYDINGDVIFSGNGAMTESVSYTVNCTVATCVKPTDLTVSDIASTSATLTWNAGAEETAWQICLDGDEDNLIDVTSASYNITGLDEATTYTAKVRANCGSDYSNWTNAISFTTTMCAVEDMCNISYELHDSFGDGWASDYGDNSAINVVDVATSEVIATWTLENGASGTGTLSVCNGRALQFVWVSGDYDDECSYRVTDVNGDEIFSGLDAMDAPVDYTVNCSLATCVKPTELAVSNIANTSATLTWTAGGEETAWQICIDGDEDNLIDVIEATYTMTELTARQEYSVKVRSNCGEGDFSSWTQPVEFTTSFCSLEDQCQISYELSVPADYAGYGYGWLDAAINVIDAETSDILDTWTVDSGESSATGTLSVCSGRDITFEWVPGYNGGQYDAILTEYTVSDVNGVIFSGTGALDADVDYTVNCSIDYCAAPYQLEADVTNTTADLSWAGNSDNYVVRYRSLTPVLADGFENGIPATWTTIDADADGNNWLAVSEIPTVYTYYASQDLSSWAHNGSDAAASPSYANGSGAFNSDHWLITPQVDLGGIMKFYVTSAYADEYEVLLSTTGTETSDFVTTLKSMDAASISWDEVTIDLSSYAGQQGYIAIHHVFEDGYFLVFDDFGIYTQGEWVEANATGNTLDLVGLTPATLYEYQVLGVCDDPNNDNWSEIASFTTEPNRYAINASAGENGTIYPEGEIVVVEGESQSFEITANDCYKIESVKVDGNIDVTDDVIANDGIYTFTGIDASHSIAATFEQISYTIDVTPGENGTITANDENGNNVNCGEDKSYTIAGNYCYRIANVMVDGDIDVTDDVIANNGIYTFTGVDAAGHSIAATFEQISYTIDVTPGENGTITANDENGNNANCGEDKTFTIAGNDCYRIENVKVDGNIDVTDDVIANNGIYTFTGVDAVHSIEATFEQISYTFEVTAGENGTITADDGNGNDANCGENKSFTIAGNDCYKIESVTVDGNIVTEAVIAANGVYTFENVNAIHSIAATFAMNTYNITATVDETSGTITGAGLANCGANVELTISANDCYRIESVAVDNIEVTDDVIANNGIYTIAGIDADHFIEATFEQITYAIEVTPGENGTITADDGNGNNANCGEDKSFTIAGNDCYRIESVTVDGTNVTEAVIANENVYTFTNVEDIHEIAATFQMLSYTITVTAGEGGSITHLVAEEAVTGNADVNCGEAQTFTVAANEGYRILSVLVDGETVELDENGVYTFTDVREGHSIEATFVSETATTYTITATAGENGTITPSGEQEVVEGTEKSFTITANDCYRIASVVVDGDTVTSELVDGVYTFTNVDAAHTIAATFEQITYTITVAEVENGTITPAEDVTVNCGTDTAFTIVANEGYRILSVLVDGEAVELDENGVYTFVNVTENHTIAATFEEIPTVTYTITATAGEGGTITPEEATVIEGENAIFTITANEGYRIASVIVDAETENETDVTSELVDGVYTFENVAADHTIAANFEEIPTYTITATAGENGTITPSGEQVVVEGTEISFTIAADNCYRIASVMVDETDVTSELVDGVYTFDDVTANHTIAATFEQITYTITVNAGENGTITPNNEGTVTVNCGADQAFTIAANEGFSILSVLVDGVVAELVDGVYTFENVTADHTIAATFVSEDATIYTIDATAGENGTITPAGQLRVVEGGSQSFTIAANDCYRIASVVVDGETVTSELVDGVYTFENVTADHTIAATFEQITYTITVAEVENGTITPNDEGGVIVNCGESKAFTITANEHYRIASVMVDEDTVTSELVDGVYTFVNVTADHTIAATFEAIPVYTITATAGENGTITPAEATVEEGGNAEFTITANEGFQIASVVVDGETDVTSELVEGVYTFTNVTANHTIAATFEALPQPNTYTITLTVGEHGSVTPSGENGIVIVNAGDDAVFTITPDDGYEIDALIVDGNPLYCDPTGETYTFTAVEANHTLEVTFEAISQPVTYTITLTVGDHGTVTPNGENGVVTVNEGETPAFVITPEEGYMIDELMIDGNVEELTEEQQAGYTYTFAAVTANHTLSVTFIETVSVDMIEAASMSVYPNPNNGMFNIDFSNIEGDATYQLIDARGAVVETRDINVMSGATMNFNHNLRPGAYFVRIISGDKVYVEQIVVE